MYDTNINLEMVIDFFSVINNYKLKFGWEGCMGYYCDVEHIYKEHDLTTCSATTIDEMLHVVIKYIWETNVKNENNLLKNKNSLNNFNSIINDALFEFHDAIHDFNPKIVPMLKTILMWVLFKHIENEATNKDDKVRHIIKEKDLNNAEEV